VTWTARGAAALLVLALGACGDGGDAEPALPVAVLAAFPAELAAVLEHMTVEDTVVVAGRKLRIGGIGDVPVIVGMTGIGLVNAARTARAVLDGFAVRGVVVSGVAGSPFRIGDVVVPERWGLTGGTAHAVPGEWIELVRETTAAGGVRLQRCTERLDAPLEDPVCTSHQPAVAVGGVGESGDPFGGAPLRCVGEGDDVFGCDVVAAAPPSFATAPAGLEAAAPNESTAIDMETAAIAAEAGARGIPFIAFRAVSDGEGDPLDLPGFPFQFFAYYRLAARNAAAATAAFVTRLGD
jgi:nucleoside phosphorylase